MMNRINLIVFIILLSGCSFSKKQQLQLFEERSYKLTPKHETTYQAQFIVKNYCSTKKCEVYLDSLVFQHFKRKHYPQQLIALYKESKYTNIDNLKVRPRDFDDYADNDHVLTYRFLNGKFLSKDRFRNGESMEKIDTANVKIEPAPPVKQ